MSIAAVGNNGVSYCQETAGKSSAEQAEKIRDFFREYTPYQWADELYSGDDMGMVTLKDFWVELFNASE